MANYNVGNIEVGVIANSKSALTQLTNIENKIKDIKNAHKSQSLTAKSSAKETVSAYKSMTNAFSQAKSSLNKIVNLNYLYVALNYLRRFAHGVTNVINKASDYAETLNKFQVSFKDMYEENLDFVNQLSKAYGFSRLTLMEYTATFNNMLKALGNLSDETSATISQTLVRMAIDYASLFNQSVDSTMKAFQSVLAGSVRPIRSASGFDVSETTIFSIYQELGGTKTMRQLTQLEKRLLRIIALQRQMKETGALLDYQNTIENFGNQIKILQEQIVEFSSTWGQLLLYYIKPAVQWINGLLIALNELGRVITEDLIESGIDIEREYGSLIDMFKDTNQAVEELSASLTQLSLDQLNVLGGTGASGIGGIDPAVLSGLQKYKETITDINMKAKDISKDILTWLGFTYDANNNLINVDETLDKLKSKIKIIGTIILSIVSIIVASKLVTSIISLVKVIGTVVKFLPLILGIGLAIAGVVQSIIAIIDMVNEGGNLDNISRLVLGISVAVMGIGALIGGLPGIIMLIVGAVGALSAVIIKNWEWLVENVFVPIGDWFVSVWNAVKKFFVEDIPNFFKSMWEKIKSFLTSLGNWIYVNVIAPIGNFFIEMINGIIGAFETLINYLLSGINSMLNNVEGIVKLFGGDLDIKDISVSFNRIKPIDTSGIDTSFYTNDTTASDSMASTTDNNVALTNAILESNNRVVQAINNKNTVLEVNGKSLAETIYDDMNDVSSRKGLI